MISDCFEITGILFLLLYVAEVEISQLELSHFLDTVMPLSSFAKIRCFADAKLLSKVQITTPAVPIFRYKPAAEYGGL